MVHKNKNHDEPDYEEFDGINEDWEEFNGSEFEGF